MPLSPVSLWPLPVVFLGDLAVGDDALHLRDHLRRHVHLLADQLVVFVVGVVGVAQLCVGRGCRWGRGAWR